MNQRTIFLTLLIVAVISYHCPKGSVFHTHSCLKCKNILNTVPNTTLMNACSCKPGFVWNQLLVKCQIKSNLKSKPMPHLQVIDQSGNSYQNQWIESRLLSADCDWTKGYILFKDIIGLTICIHCSKITLSDGTAASSNTCNCISPAFWTASGCTCGISNQLYFNGTSCAPCSSLSTTNQIQRCNSCATIFSNTFRKGCFDCRLIPMTQGLAIPSGDCNCPSGFYFNIVSGTCDCDWYNQWFFLNGSSCIDCDNTPSNLIVGCRNCDPAQGYFQLNQFTCINASLVNIPNYNKSTGNCANGTQIIQQILTTNNYCGCPAIKGLYWNNQTCISCTSPPPNTFTCTSCSSSEGFFLNNLECVYCPNVANSFGNALRNGCECFRNYYFNLQTNQCKCNIADGFMLTSSQNCISCKIIQFSTGTSSNNACNCIANYKWNATTLACQCAQPSCFSCLAIVGSTGVINNGNCQCIVGWAWNATLKKCQCDNTQNFGLKNGICYDCRQIQGSDGTAGPNGCNCQNNFVFFPPTQSSMIGCFCPSAQSLFIYKGNCSSCSGVLPAGATTSGCISCNFNQGFVYIDGKCVSCIGLFGTTGVANSDNTCACNDSTTQTWSPTKLICICDIYKSAVEQYINGEYICSACFGYSCIFCQTESYYAFDQHITCTNCASMPHNNGNSIDKCICEPGYSWNNKVFPYSCVCSIGNLGFIANNTCKTCSSLPSANQTDCIICNKNAGYYLAVNGSCVQCSSLNYSNGVSTDQGCVCISSVWNESLLACTNYSPIKCPAGQIIINGTCSCPTTSINTTSGCLSCLNMSLGTNATNPLNNSQCGCINNLIFTISNGLAICVCPPTLVLNSTQFCACNSTSILLLSGKCYSCVLANSANTINPNLTSACLCKTNFIWNFNQATQTGTCQCNTPYTLSGSNCICNPTSYITLPNGQCYSCVGILRGTNTVNTTNSSRCSCQAGFTFSYNTTAGIGICGCSAPLIFNWPQTQCINCSNILYSNGTSGSNCICNANFIYSGSLMACSCPSPYKLNTTYGTCCDPFSITYSSGCFSCLKIANGIGSVNSTNTSACSCLSSFTFVWNSQTNTGSCACPLNSIYNVVTSTCTCNQTISFQTSKGCYLCSQIVNSKGITNRSIANTCLCNDYFFTYSWNNVALTGTCTCNSPYAIDPITKLCDCSSTSIRSNSTGFLSCVSCSANIYSTGVRINATVCACRSPLIWLNNIASCGCNSTSVVYVVGTTISCIACDYAPNAIAKLNSNTCSCKTLGGIALTWQGNRCFCPSNYILLLNSNTCFKCPTTAYNSYSCNCNTGFIWSDLSNTCIKCPTSRINNFVCDCGVGRWDIISLTCLSPAICTSALNSQSCAKCANQNALLSLKSISVIAYNVNLVRILGSSSGMTPLLNLAKTDYSLINLKWMCDCKAGFKWQPNLMRCINNNLVDS